MAEIESIRRGDTLDYILRLAYYDTENNTETIIPANGTLIFTLKYDQTDDDPGVLQHIVYRDDDDILNPDGLIYMTVPKDKTINVLPGYYFYDFQFIFLDGKVKTILPTIGEDEMVEVYDHTTHLSTYP